MSSNTANIENDTSSTTYPNYRKINREETQIWALK